MATGTVKKHQEKLYCPKLKVDQIKVELFYETGQGQVIFDNIALREAGDKPGDAIKEVCHTLEERIDLPLSKKHLLAMPDYVYQVAAGSNQIVRIDNGLLEPLQEGQTLLEVFTKEGQKIADLPVTVTAADNSLMTTLVSKWRHIIVGEDCFDASNPAMQVLNQKLDDSVTKNLNNLVKDQSQSYLWEDLKDFWKSSTMTATYRRLEEMAKQVNSPASKYYQDRQLIRLIKDKLAWLHLNHYNPQKDIEGNANWWDYEIGTPRAIVNTLTLLYPYASQAEIKAQTKSISHFVPNPKQFRSTLVNPFKAIGGNLVDMGRVKIMEALLTHDETKLKESLAALDTLFEFQKDGSKGEGFYEDGSYIDHINVAYTGAYGNVLIDGLSQLTQLIQESPLALCPQKLAVINHWIETSFFPLMVHGELMDMSRGRAISREAASSKMAALEALRGILRLSEVLPETNKNSIQAQLKTILAFHDKETVLRSLSSYYDINLFEQFFANQTIKQLLLSTNLSVFQNMDKLAYYHADKDFGFALSMHSNKTLNFEAMNNENTRGWHTSDGMFYLYNNDWNHYSDKYWPTINPLKMPGTTEAEGNREDVTDAYLKKLTDVYKEKAKEKAGMSTLPSSFVGAIKGDDKTALAAMDFQNWDRTVSAKKSWTILDDRIVFLGAGICSTKDQAVSTTIDQRKDNPENPYRLLVNGQEVSLTNEVLERDDVTSVLLLSQDDKNNIGYLFARPTTLVFSRQEQSGRWSDINKGATYTELITQSFITISQKHQQPNDTYAYTLLPNISQEDFDKAREEGHIEVVRNDSDLQILHDWKTDLWTVVNYRNGHQRINDQLTLEKAGLYLYQNVGEVFKNISHNTLA
ncbi:UNVERIFIED_CONTAM: polysaccharide lyase 8 family protein [Streptococcus canis]